jgi:ABC-2 type transport system permease protein
MFASLDAPSAAWGEPRAPQGALRQLWNRIATMSLAELRKVRHDRTELYMRAIQPALWLLIFGETFTRIHAIPTTNGLPYLDYLAPGVMAQSALFIAISRSSGSGTSGSSPS